MEWWDNFKQRCLSLRAKFECFCCSEWFNYWTILNIVLSYNRISCIEQLSLLKAIFRVSGLFFLGVLWNEDDYFLQIDNIDYVKCFIFEVLLIWSQPKFWNLASYSYQAENSVIYCWVEISLLFVPDSSPQGTGHGQFWKSWSNCQTSLNVSLVFFLDSGPVDIPW